MLIDLAIKNYLEEKLNYYYKSSYVRGNSASDRFKFTVWQDYSLRQLAFQNEETGADEVNQYGFNENAFLCNLSVVGERLQIPNVYASEVYIPVQILVPIMETYTDSDGEIKEINNIEDVIKTLNIFSDNYNATTIDLTADYKGLPSVYKLSMNVSVPSSDGLEFITGENMATITFSISGVLTSGMMYGDSFAFTFRYKNEEGQIDTYTPNRLMNGVGRGVSAYTTQLFNEEYSKSAEQSNQYSNDISFFVDDSYLSKVLVQYTLDSSSVDLESLDLHLAIENGLWDDFYVLKPIQILSVSTSIEYNAMVLNILFTDRM